MSEEAVPREAARVVLIDPEKRLLLQEIQSEPDAVSIWITPGGGLKAEESHLDAAVRELREEVGESGARIGPCIWTRDHEFTFRGIRYRQREQFFVAWADTFEADHGGLEEHEVEIIRGHRWWTLPEIADASPLSFAPRRLAHFLEPLLEGTIPASPVPVGV